MIIAFFKKLYFAIVIRFFYALLGTGGLFIGPFLLPIRILFPEEGQLIARRIISAGVRLYLLVLDKVGMHQLQTTFSEDYKGCIFISNHTSRMDALYYMALFPEICAIIKYKIFYLSPFCILSYCAGYIANDPKGSTVDKAVSLLNKGQSIFIFPEGTRKRKNHASHFKRGASMIALKSKAPLYFGYIEHSEEILGKETPIFYAPEEKVIAKISFHKVPDQLLTIKQNETPWIAARRITKSLETALKSPENFHFL